MSDEQRFDWDEGNLDHLIDCDPDEAQEAILDPKRVPAPAYNSEGERRWAYLGATEDSGAILFVVFTYRNGKILVITCRDATSGERRRYRGKANR
jgi:uncharacterized DUF497 family protein